MSTDADEPEAPEPTPTPQEIEQAELASAKIHERYEREVMGRRGLTRDPTRSYDKVGRNQPRRLSILTILRGLPAVMRRMRTVPASAIEEEHFDEERDEVLLTCPCGAHPIVPRLEITKCPGCERWYLYVQQVFVAYGAMEPPPLTAGQPQPDSIGTPPPHLEG